MKKILIALLMTLVPNFAQATVILVYHHVSETTPKSTSISPKQFELHLNYLKDNGFKVIALNEMVDKLKAKQPLEDKTVVITFDDGYSDILYNGHPLLQKFGYPYTMFINPNTVPNNSGIYLDWPQIKQMADDGVLIANHGLVHDSLIKTPKGVEAQTWLTQKLDELEQSEQIIKDKLDQNWKYFALPYGEYTPQAQQELASMGYAVFTQQSGPVGDTTDITAIPRFPASMPYDQLGPLKDKLNSLAFNVSAKSQRAQTIVPFGEQPEKTVEVSLNDFYPNMLACFIAGGGKAEITWQGKESFTMSFDANFKPGRNRSNCTAPSISKSGRFYWYSKPWFVPKADGSWYTD
ncbi:polysaccharide deacetylase family protein [Thalassotalea psychrophila]|uniref:Polysaccharide deacetylase family protein n=1 Tax=Thalassotalea psychrophila TaxID=3065647 RepID=A0ABY9TTD3_9GAMM|nr:polysaccharide deacetylase family protein [Colwelliaceae bacterium SQ149]